MRTQLIQPYNAEWPRMFEAIRSVLLSGLAGLRAEVYHVGSTAVPGLAAKPIIDMDIRYGRETEFALLVERMQGLGYRHAGDQGIPDREAFHRREDAAYHPVLDQIRHHLYACSPDSREFRRHILLRDRLRADPKARDSYAELKRAIAAQAGEAHSEYARLKESEASAFIMGVLGDTPDSDGGSPEA